MKEAKNPYIKDPTLPTEQGFGPMISHQSSAGSSNINPGQKMLSKKKARRLAQILEASKNNEAPPPKWTQISDHECKISGKTKIKGARVFCEGCRFYKFEYEPGKCKSYKAGQRTKMHYKVAMSKAELDFLLAKRGRNTLFCHFGMKVFCDHPDVQNFALSSVVKTMAGPPKCFYGQNIKCEFTLL